MPWWIWLILALFMVAMLVAGVAYVLVHGLRALHGLGELGARFGEVTSRLGDSVEASDPGAPMFTRTWSEGAERYADAHAENISRRGAKRERHVERWAEWSRFNGGSNDSPSDRTR